VTDCHIQETVGRPRPPSLLRVKDRPPLTGEDARNFFTPPVTVEVYLTEVLGRDELLHYEGHIVELHLKGLGVDVVYLGPRSEAGGTVLRFQAPSYGEIYALLPALLAPFPRAGAIDWRKTLENVPSDERVEAIRALVVREEWLPPLQFAEHMMAVFEPCRHAMVSQIRARGQIQQLTIDIITDPLLADALVKAKVMEAAAPRKGIEMTITNVLGGNIVGSAVGAGSTVTARDINAIINSVNQADGLDPEVKRVVIAALQAPGSVSST